MTFHDKQIHLQPHHIMDEDYKSMPTILKRMSSKKILNKELQNSIEEKLKSLNLDTSEKDSRCLHFLCSIRVKTLLVVGALLLMLAFIFLVVLLGVFPNSFVQIEQTQTRQAMSRVMRSMYDQTKALKNLLSNNAGTQFSVDFVLSPEPDSATFIDDNYPFVNHVGLGCNHVAYYFPNGTKIFSTGWDLVTGETIPYPPVLETITPGVTPIAMNFTDADYFEAGILSYNNQVMIVVGSPIFDIDGATYGYCIFARILTPSVVQKMAFNTQLCITVVNYNTTTSKSETAQYGSAVKNLRATVPLSHEGTWSVDQTIPVTPFDGSFLTNRQCWVGSQDAPGNVTTPNRVMTIVPVVDIYGSQVMIMRLDMTRSALSVGLTAILINILVLAFLLVTIIIIILVFMELFLLRRVTRLSREIRNATEGLGQDLDVRINGGRGKDELSLLTRIINELLYSLQVKNSHTKSFLQKIAYQEQRSRATTNSILDFVISTDDNGSILTINNSVNEYLGYDSTELERKNINTILQCTWEDILDLCKDSDTFPPPSFESTLVHKNQQKIPVTVLASYIRKSRKHVEAMYEDTIVLFLRNNTEKKSILEKLDLEMKNIEAYKLQEEFENMLRSLDERFNFVDFCSKRNDVGTRNLFFLLDAIEFRQEADVHRRERKQKEIIAKYLNIGAPQYLTLKHALMERELTKIQKSAGREDVFKNLEDAARKKVSGRLWRAYLASTKDVE